jgi:hypothetical protein
MSDSAVVIAINFVIALSGWAGLYYDHFTHKPRIRGKVFGVFNGQWDAYNKRLSSYFVFLHLTNARRNAVTIVDYEMEIQIDGEWIRLERVYGIASDTLKYQDEQGKPFTIPAGKMIYDRTTGVEFGKPLQGFVMFAGEPSLFGKQPSAYRITCLDEFDQKHVIETTPDKLGHTFRFFELAGIKATDAMVGPTPPLFR